MTPEQREKLKEKIGEIVNEEYLNPSYRFEKVAEKILQEVEKDFHDISDEEHEQEMIREEKVQ
jgi:hypothetical protein